MMKLWITLFVAVVLALLLPCATDAQETITGSWNAQLQPDNATVMLEISYGTWNHNSNWGSARPLADLRGLDAASAARSRSFHRFRVLSLISKR